MYKILIYGTVQGVGFRPYIYRIAKENSLKGYVKNIGSGVEILINDGNFIGKLTDLPPLAKISNSLIKEVKLNRKFSNFQIIESTKSSEETELPPDIFMCDDCLRELKDKNNRRNNYYFITCTNCGPRFSIIKDYPYDRPMTSMDRFKMCPECKKEYSNPLNRRYHAQTIACKNCGPKLKLLFGNKDRSGNTDIKTIKKAADLIQKGEPVAIKGVGGFHICSLCDFKSVKRIRKMLGRLHKPFAIMVKDLKMLRDIAEFDKKEEELLTSPQRPIVVLRKLSEDFDEISELNSIGVMLPYTSLHYILFDFIDEPLLMTSCNFPGEPISINEQINNHFLTHERDIVNRCDDSVLKVINKRVFFLRRSRGYTPQPVRLPFECEDTLALGAEINNTICTVKKDKCFISQHIGETSNPKTLEFMKETISKFIHLTRLKPKKIVCDLHPDYNSTFLAEELSRKYGVKLIRIQHHKAHIAGVAAEHGISDYVGIAADGLGYGEDGMIWGGEIFSVKGGNKFKRIGCLEEQPQIGGDTATLDPRKMLLGILQKVISKEEILKLNLFKEKDTELLLNAFKNNFNVVQTTSTGRIIDAASALLGICQKRTYDGRPAMMLESRATEPLDFEPKFEKKEGRTILKTSPLFKFLVENLKEDKGKLAATTLMYLARGLLKIAQKENKPIVFSGGVAYNRMITTHMLNNRVIVNKEIPCGDGGVCYGQAYLANLEE